MSDVLKKLDDAAALLKAAKRTKRIKPYFSKGPEGAERRIYLSYLTRALHEIRMAKIIVEISDNYEGS
jgi:hypothetical protein